MLLLGRKQKQGGGECSPKQNLRQEWEGFGEKEMNGGEERSSGELWVERSFIGSLGLEGVVWGYLWRFEKIDKKFIC